MCLCCCWGVNKERALFIPSREGFWFFSDSTWLDRRLIVLLRQGLHRHRYNRYILNQIKNIFNGTAASGIFIECMYLLRLAINIVTNENKIFLLYETFITITVRLVNILI